MRDILYHLEPDGGEGDGDGGTGDEGTGEEETQPTPEEIAEIREENARLKSQAAKARTEAARRAKAEKDAARSKAQEDGDVATLQKQLDEERAARTALESRLQQQSAQSIATTLGAVDPAVVVRLIDWDTIADPDDEGEVRQAIRSILKAKPYLRSTTRDPDAGRGGGEEGKERSTSINDVLRRAAGHR